jgi:predicted phage terminase large subunit-like protein
MYPLSKLADIKGGMTSEGILDEWEALYQQRPKPAETGEVKSEWFEYYTRLPDDQQYMNIVSWDTAGTVSERADYTVGLAAALGMKDRKFYLKGMYRKQAEFHTLMRDVPHFNAIHEAHAVLIESKGTGTSLIQVLKIASGQNIIAIAPQRIGDKQTRFELAVPALEAKRVLLPRNADWVPRFLEEMLTFPGAAHDDIPDAFSQLINQYTDRGVRRSTRPLIGA